MKTRASWLGHLVRPDSFCLSLLSECTFVKSPIYIYCESRSCYALDALFIFFFCIFPFKYLFSLAGVFTWDSAVCALFFFFSFPSCDFTLVSDTSARCRLSFIVTRVCASSVQLAEGCSAIAPRKNVELSVAVAIRNCV